VADGHDAAGRRRELSEVIGADTVKMDREQRILGLRQAAEAAEKISPRATGLI